MATVELTTTATVDSNASISLRVEEDIGDTGVADNVETVSISSGTNTYTLSSLSGGTGNAYEVFDARSSNQTAGSYIDSATLNTDATNSLTASPGGAIVSTAQTPTAGASGSGSANAITGAVITAVSTILNTGISGNGSVSQSPSSTVSVSSQTENTGINPTEVTTGLLDGVGVIVGTIGAGVTGSGSASGNPSSVITSVAKTPNVGVSGAGYMILSPSPSGSLDVEAKTADAGITGSGSITRTASGSIVSSAVTLDSGARVNNAYWFEYNGSSWELKFIRWYDGSQWTVPYRYLVYDGTEWVVK